LKSKAQKMKTTANHPQTFRSIPATSTPVSKTRVAALLDQEWARFKEGTGKSAVENDVAKETMPMGVPSSFQHWDPYPIAIASAQGAYMTDVDGRKLLDMSMGFGAMFAGHLNPTVVEEIKNSLSEGMLFVTPSPISRDAAERICKRFAIDQVRFANSGTEATMYAVRLARSFTGKSGVVKLEGGYHGSFDPLMVSCKSSLSEVGDADNPTPVPNVGTVPGDVYVVPFNNIESLERIFAAHSDNIACFILEPVLENIAIVLPDAG
jgi:glutamate-1-semialdehyde 2,1-aminomutase